MTSISSTSLNTLTESVGSFSSVIINSRPNTYRQILGAINDSSLNSLAQYYEENRIPSTQNSIEKQLMQTGPITIKRTIQADSPALISEMDAFATPFKGDITQISNLSSEELSPPRKGKRKQPPSQHNQPFNIMLSSLTEMPKKVHCKSWHENVMTRVHMEDVELNIFQRIRRFMQCCTNGWRWEKAIVHCCEKCGAEISKFNPFLS